MIRGFCLLWCLPSLRISKFFDSSNHGRYDFRLRNSSAHNVANSSETAITTAALGHGRLTENSTTPQAINIPNPMINNGK